MKKTEKSTPRSDARAAFLRGALLLIPAVVIAGVLCFLAYRFQVNSAIEILEGSSLRTADVQQEAIRGALDSIASDLLFLSEQNELAQFLDTGDSDFLEAVASEYVALSERKATYDQIRFLDEFGTEIVRVNYNNGSVSIVPGSELQSKAGRYYFTDAFLLDEGDIFISPLDLNIERGEIERPIKPMMRFATPVFDTAGKKRGIVLINYLAARMFAALDNSSIDPHTEWMLTNSDGYWLRGLEPSRDWGFMYAEGAEWTVHREYPGIWRTISDTLGGQLRTPHGLITYRTLQPVSVDLAISSTGASEAFASSAEWLSLEDYVWKLIVLVPEGYLSAAIGPIAHTWLLVFSALALMATIATALLIRLWLIQASHRRSLVHMARHDSLTGVFNRHYFDELILYEEKRATRYRHTISFLMVDVTRFKLINDQHGHQTGDLVLKGVAALLQEAVRSSDIVVRFGGDEFLLVFPETDDEAEAAKRRILQQLASANSQHVIAGMQVVLALGTSIWRPENGTSVLQSIADADKRMYEHKQTQHEADTR